jgi:GTPase SAR1 family protein
VIPAPQRNDADADDDDMVTGNLQLSVWDMPGSEAYGSLRSLSYPSANVFVLCIALDHHGAIDMCEAGAALSKVCKNEHRLAFDLADFFNHSGSKK